MAVVCLTNAQSLDRFCLNVPNGQLVAHPRSCQHWMICQNNVVADTGMCPEIFYFDAARQMCSHPDDAGCSFDDPWYSWLDCPIGSTETRHNWLNCDQYTQCINGMHRILNCPPGLWWHQATQSCQFPGSSDCPQREPLSLPCAADRTYVSYDPWVGCHGYIFCLNGVARVVDCHHGFTFDEVSHRCQPSNIASCPMSASTFSHGIERIFGGAEQTDFSYYPKLEHS